jgi:hypothetical protein
MILFHHCDKISEGISAEARKFYFGAGIQRFWSTVTWPGCFEFIMVGRGGSAWWRRPVHTMVTGRKRPEEEGAGIPITPSSAAPNNLTSSN